MISTRGWIAAAAVTLMVAAAGCVQVKEPLVKFDSSGLNSGGSRPDTRVKSTDSDEVRQLKERVAQLERQVADTKEEAEKEKAKRKMAEEKAESYKDRVEKLEEQLREARRR